MKTAAVKLIAATIVFIVAPSIVEAQSEPTTWMVGATGNEARYRVRELLAGMEFENDAVGATRDISGMISLDSLGHVVPGASSIVIVLAGLESDKSRRDGFLRRRTLETERFPEAKLTVDSLTLLPADLATAGEFEFTLYGALKIKDNLFPTIWEVSAVVENGHMTGSANTAFTFAEAGLSKPSVMSVLSVKNTIKLEYDFHLVQRQD